MLFSNCNIEVKDKKLMRLEKRRKGKREWEGVKGAEEREKMKECRREEGKEEGRKGEMSWREEGEKEGGEVRRGKERRKGKQTRIIIHVFSE